MAVSILITPPPEGYEKTNTIAAANFPFSAKDNKCVYKKTRPPNYARVLDQYHSNIKPIVSR
jgi:hypothetical protein